MKRMLAYIGVVLLACGCGLDELALSDAGGSLIEFSASKMRVITKAGDSAEPFAEETNFRLFAVQNVDGVSDWTASGMKFHNVEGIGSDAGKVDYSIDGKKASYDVGRNLDFYGLTYGTSSKISIIGDAGSAPEVSVSLSEGRFPDLMYSNNLKNKNSSSGLLQMEFRHTLSKLKFEVLKQDETADDDKKLANVLLRKVVLKGSAASAVFNAGTGAWSYGASSVQDRVVYETATGLKITESAQMLKSGEDEIEMLAVPNSGQLILEVTLDMDGNPDATDDKTVAYNLMASESEFLKLEQNHEYTLSIVILKNDVRIVTVTPKVYEWIDVELDTGNAYFGQPVYFGGLMWMDRNLGAKSSDCENDWEACRGYYYQFGRNIPYIFDKDKYDKEGKGGPKGYAYFYTFDENGNRVYGAVQAGETINMNGVSVPVRGDNVAVYPGEEGKIYNFINDYKNRGSGGCWWLDATEEKEDLRCRNNWTDVEKQPCPKGWRLPLRADFAAFIPVTKLKTNWHKENYTLLMNNSNKEDIVYGKINGRELIYIIKNQGRQDSYRIRLEAKDNKDKKQYYEISYYAANDSELTFAGLTDADLFYASGIDWDHPSEVIQFPACGFIWSAQTKALYFDGSHTILRTSQSSIEWNGDTSSGNYAQSSNWVAYFRKDSQSFGLNDNSRKALGDQIRCVRDVNAKW